MRVHGFITLFLAFIFQSVHAEIQNLSLSSKDKIPMERWIFDSDPKNLVKPMFVSPKAKLKSPVKELVEIRRAELLQDYEKCIQIIDKDWNRLKAFQFWLLKSKAQCLIQSNSDKFLTYNKILENFEKNLNWMSNGPASSQLKALYTQILLKNLQISIQKNRKLAWTYVEKIQARLDTLDDFQKSRFFQSIGDLSFAEQKFQAAREYYLKIPKENLSDDLSKKLSQVEEIINANKESNRDRKKPVKNIVSSNFNVQTQNEMSTDELDLFNRLNKFLQDSDLTSFGSDSIEFIKKFPGSVRAKWAQDKFMDIYTGLLDKSDEKYDSFRQSLFKNLMSLEGDRLFDIAKILFQRGEYKDAGLLLKKYNSQSENSTNTKALDMAGHSAFHMEQYSDALNIYKEIINRHSGTNSSKEALFRSGLIEYRRKNFSQSIGFFEKLLSQPQIDNFELMSHYWLWRSYQKSGSSKAEVEAQYLIDRYPLSYYGIRAQIEKNSGVFSIDFSDSSKNAQVLEASLWLTDYHRLSYERVQSLLAAGWLDEAQSEMKDWPQPKTPKEKILRARLLASAMAYSQVVKFVNDAWDEDPSLKQKEWFQLVFPNEFQKNIEEQAQIRGISPILVRSLIKQESAYQIKALSTSKAMGLMQMIPPTAKEIAQDLKIQNLQIPEDMNRPLLNIQMGTYYLAKLLRQFKGHVPLALAAYNAGPARVERWMKQRPSLAKLIEKKTSDPEDEMWFDELPWTETSFYVKAILRNYVLYQAIDQGRVSFSNPIWSGGK